MSILKSERTTLNFPIYCIKICCGLILLTIAFYRITEIGLSTIDDDWMLIENPLVKKLSLDPNYFRKLFSSFHHIQYSPLNTIYYGLIYKINGYDPYFYHMGSLIIHFINGILLYILGKNLLTQFGYFNDSKKISFIVCAAWIILPLNVEAVVWVSASKVLLFTTFTIVSFLLLLKAVIAKSKIILLTLSLISFFLACLSKEQSIAVSCMLILYILWFRKVINLKFKKYFYIYILLLLSITAIFILITLKANENAWAKMPSFPFYQRLVLSFYCIFFYIFNLLIPINLHYHYPFPLSPGDSLPKIYYVFPFLFIILFLFQFVLKYKLNNLWKFSILCFIINIGLTLQIIPMTRPALMADRYMYLPAFFLLLPIVYTIISTLKNSKRENLFILGLIVYILILACYSNTLVIHWNSNLIK